MMHGCLCKMWFEERKKLMYGHVQCATITLIKESLLFVNLVLNGIISTVLALQGNQSQRTGFVGNVVGIVNHFVRYS